MLDYLIMKDDFKFKQILSNGYSIYEDVPQKAAEKIMANGSIKVVYKDYTATTITISFGNMNGTDSKNYYEKLVDGKYTYWSKNSRTYKTANFIVDKGENSMISAKSGEIWNDFTVTLKKASEV